MMSRLGPGLGFANLFRQHRYDIKQVAHDAKIGDFKDRRFGVFIDGDDRSRTLHAHDVLDSAADSKRNVDFWSQIGRASCRERV